MTVDDDPGVSCAVARDLRRHFGTRCRVARSGSGDAALEALRELTARASRSRCCWPTTGCPGWTAVTMPVRGPDLRAGSPERVASAVGDGAMAVTLVHRYPSDA